MDERLQPGMCGCCETAAPPTPLRIENRPGLSAVAYRIGTFASFREAMLRALSREPALRGLTTRERDDPAITVLELWAAVADVLTFYQERIANESFLRTAVHRDSVLRMVRMLDYHLRPGLAATARLAFTVEMGHAVRIPVGLKVMSTPGQDERPQIFETLETVNADWRLNRLAVLPRPVAVNPLGQGRSAAFLTTDEAGWIAAKTLMPKDKLVLFNETSGGGAAAAVDAAFVWSLSDVMSWALPPPVMAPPQPWGPPADVAAEFELRAERAQPLRRLAVFSSSDLNAPEEKEVQEVRVERNRFLLVWTTPVVKGVWTASTKARIFRQKMHVFGYDAPTRVAKVVLDPKAATAAEQVRWSSVPIPDGDFGVTGSVLSLDRVYKDLTVGDELLVYEKGTEPQVVTVTRLSEGEAVLGNDSTGTADSLIGTASDYRHRGTVTRVEVKDLDRPIGDRRNVTIYQLAGPKIPLWTADFPFPPVINEGALYVPAVRLDDAGETLEVGRTIVGRELKSGFAIRLTDLDEGRQVMLEDQAQRPIAAVLKARRVETLAKQDFLVLEVASLSPIRLDAMTAVLLGNVTTASHGETVRSEPLGDGDAATAFQRFALRKKPLTYLPSARSARGEASLRVMVNGEKWQEIESLYGQPATARTYTARQADDGTTVLQFGDGVTGARLPTGRGNVIANYRQGAGLEGRVKARQIDILLERPPGLKSVVNPAPAEGGADPESLDRAREATPATVKTFGRAVSLLDFESLALESGLVAKAAATWVWVGLEKAVHLTVAGQEGGAFSPEALRDLHSGLTRQRDPNHPLLLANVLRVPVVIQARVVVDGRFVRETVRQAARRALLGAFAFANVPFARPVHLSDVYRILQELTEVTYVDVDLLHFKDWESWRPEERTLRGATGAKVQEHLRFFAARPRPAAGGTQDPVVTARFGSAPPAVLPAEQAFIQDEAADVQLTAEGGLEG
jgi:baseplate J-like protein